MAALPVVSVIDSQGNRDFKTWAEEAYELADAMLAARAKADGGEG